MTSVVVVGSGASGVHFAVTALERGFGVTLVDAGYERPDPVFPDASFDELKERLPDPVEFFLGDHGQGVVYPATKPSYYGHPPSKAYVFRVPARFSTSARHMTPMFSFARGGLAEAWTAGSYEFSADDLSKFPIPHADMAAGYAQVARRIGIGGEADDLARFVPFEAGYLPPLPMDQHSEFLLDRYRARRERLRDRLGFHLGRSRVATLSQPHGDRPACTGLGRCLWGCPTDAIYSPAATLRECLGHPRFTYRPGLIASHFDYDAQGKVTALVAHGLSDEREERFAAECYALAAGALATSKIVLDSIYRQTNITESLPGLMDNRQIHMPFLTPGMVGEPVVRDAYQFHHLAFGMAAADPAEHVHGQITTLKAASIHPIVQTLPLDYRGALAVFQGLRAGLAVANLNLHDWRRPDSHVTIRPIGDGRTELVIDYRDDPEEPARIDAATRRVKRAIRALGGFVPPGMTRILPKGASVHYAGTLPMSQNPIPLGCSPDGRSWDFPNLYFADGATFPFLSAKNLTFTLMANAVRIANRLG